MGRHCATSAWIDCEEGQAVVSMYVDFVINECGRADFMPFLVGLGFSFLLLGIGTLPDEETKKSSKYYNDFVLGKVKEAHSH